MLAHTTIPYSSDNVRRLKEEWLESASRRKNTELSDWMKEAVKNAHPANMLIEGVFGNSPFLSKLLIRYPEVLRQSLTCDSDEVYKRTLNSLLVSHDEQSQTEFIRSLRIAKGKLALLIALADIAGWWNLEKITAALSEFAEICLKQTVDFLLTQAEKRGEIKLSIPQSPSKHSGIIILGMGKLGGNELNYSSDIDLIIMFEKGRLTYTGRHTEQQFMNKLAYDLVHIMQERTADGYVFRTDLRLRPDPASTPPAINTDAAYYYYESVGQNWERAAMIKARPIAGDIDAGNEFIKHISPFMWRRNLDFAAIQDIHSIKRQMDSHEDKKISLEGHNVKLGRGGIREIEFYVQIHQLIWGGKMTSLRQRSTCQTLDELNKLKLISNEEHKPLIEAYTYLRKLEHRLQMVADQQTHSLPSDESELHHIACFMGFDDTKDFMQQTTEHLCAVHYIFSNSFQSADKLGETGNLVFTGVSHDPDTLDTLSNMGYINPKTVSEIVMGWHRGSKRATRTKRTRELLTEIMPTLLKRLSETANPDEAFLKFNDFLTNLPAGVQLFSLFNANPQLLVLVADIMGSAPKLAYNLSQSPALLDSVLYGDFYHDLPSREQLRTQLDEILPDHIDYEHKIETMVRFRNERQFQAGVQLLKHMIDAKESGAFLSMMAELVLQKALALVTAEFEKSHGKIIGGEFAVISLGKLGSYDMTFGSDIDLVFTYTAPDDAISDGLKQFNASVYYNRLAQRLVNALSAMSREGRLYEVDTRLRPSGTQGVLACSLTALHKYFDESAWTFEYMAFSKARVVAGNKALSDKVIGFIDDLMATPKDAETLKKDVWEMRERIEKEFPKRPLWTIKYTRGGLIDIDFIAQYLLLLHAPKHGRPIPANTANILHWLLDKEAIDPDIARELCDANELLTELFHMLRLCNYGELDEKTALPGLKRLLAEGLEFKNFYALKQKLIAVEQAVLRHYNALLT